MTREGHGRNSLSLGEKVGNKCNINVINTYINIFQFALKLGPRKTKGAIPSWTDNWGTWPSSQLTLKIRPKYCSEFCPNKKISLVLKIRARMDDFQMVKFVAFNKSDQVRCFLYGSNLENIHMSTADIFPVHFFSRISILDVSLRSRGNFLIQLFSLQVLHT